MCLLSMSFELFRVSVCNLLLEQMFVYKLVEETNTTL
jgi:hypothetical protein